MKCVMCHSAEGIYEYSEAALFAKIVQRILSPAQIAVKFFRITHMMQEMAFARIAHQIIKSLLLSDAHCGVLFYAYKKNPPISGRTC